jgi:hypothetical protein
MSLPYAIHADPGDYRFASARSSGDQATERGKPFGGLALERRGKQIRLGAKVPQRGTRGAPGLLNLSRYAEYLLTTPTGGGYNPHLRPYVGERLTETEISAHQKNLHSRQRALEFTLAVL